MTAESSLLARIRRAVGTLTGVRLFRNDCGVAWTGEVVAYDRAKRRVTLRNAQRITYGLIPGSGDLIGWQSIEITPDMVGRRVAVFTSIEVKTKKGRASPKQRNWRDRVNEAGGNAGIARSIDDAIALLDNYE